MAPPENSFIREETDETSILDITAYFSTKIKFSPAVNALALVAIHDIEGYVAITLFSANIKLAHPEIDK